MGVRQAEEEEVEEPLQEVVEEEGCQPWGEEEGWALLGPPGGGVGPQEHLASGTRERLTQLV